VTVRWSPRKIAAVIVLGMAWGCESTQADPPVVILVTDADSTPVPLDAGVVDAGRLESRCVESVPWGAGTPIFRDVTAEWGLHDLKVEGVLVHVIYFVLGVYYFANLKDPFPDWHCKTE